MKKYILSILFGFTFASASLVNGVAIVVNQTPITLYDIEKSMQLNQISKQAAVEGLIDQILYNEELEKNNISVDIFDIDNHIEKLAAQNKMSVLDFKSLVKQQQNYELFKAQIKQQLLHQKLIQSIARGKLKIATKEDLKIYFENNKEEFQVADTIEVIAYVSRDKNLLEQQIKNPMMQNNAILIQALTLKQDELTPQTKYIINSTKSNKFSAIFVQNKSYNMFFIKEKKDVTTQSFDKAEDKIFQTVMKNREKSYLKEYFETLKITADIKVLR
jgi:hypothetical protein